MKSIVKVFLDGYMNYSSLVNWLSQNIRKMGVMTAAVASLSFAPTGWADQITLQRSGSGWIGGSASGTITGYSGGGVYAGQFSFTVTSSENSLWKADDTFGAFCIDIINTLKTGPLTYTLQPADGGSTIPPRDPAFAQINWLFDNYAGNGGGGVNTGKDVALQLAIWEVLQETNITDPFNLTTGNFTAGSGFGQARTTANNMLSMLKNAADFTEDYRSEKWDFYSLVPGYDQNQNPSQGLLTWREKPEDPGQPPQEISEPGTLLLLSIGLGVVFFSTRHLNISN